jgi:type I restriction enzyme M protein
MNRAPRKSGLYASLRASCAEVRGGINASQYKGCVRFMLFINYIGDKYGNSFDFAPDGEVPHQVLVRIAEDFAKSRRWT